MVAELVPVRIHTMTREISDGRDEKPGEPYAFAMPPVAHAIHAVIPVPCTNQREAMRPEAVGVGKRALAMNEQGLRVVTHLETRIAIGFFGRERGRPQKRNQLAQDGFVSGRLNIMSNGVR